MSTVELKKPSLKRGVKKTDILILMKIALVLCGTYTALIFNVQSTVFFVQAFKGNKTLAFSCICAVVAVVFAGLLLLLFKWNLLEKLYQRLREKTLLEQIALCLFAMMCAGTYLVQFYDSAHVSAEHLGEVESWWFHILHAFDFTAAPAGFTPPRWILSLVLFLPLMTFYLYMTMSLAEIVKSVLTTLSKAERTFLFVASAAVIAYIVFLYNSTTIYYGGMDNIYSYDSLSDSSYLINPFYYWSYYQYPLEPNFSLPIMMLAKAISPSLYLWEIIIRTLVQLLLLLLTIVMLSRMISENPMVRIYSMLIFTFSFPVLILAPITERRVITLIFLVIAVYQSVHKQKEDKFWLSAASGAVICNAYVALLSIRSKKTWWKDILLFAGVFLFLTAFLGKISGLLDLQSQINNFENSGWIDEQLDTKTKLLHYLNLVCSSLFAPLSQASENNTSWIMTIMDAGKLQYLHILGFAMLALATAGFVLNYKNRFAQTAFAGILASVFFVFIKALNINENAVVLNTLFFAWAFVSLIIMAIDKLLRNKIVKHIVLAAIFGACYFYNIMAAYQLYTFGKAFHPIA